MSQVTCAYLDWLCPSVAAEGKQTLSLVWDNASWHGSKAVCAWLKQHNRAARPAQAAGQAAVRVVAFWLPVRSRRLNAIEPTWLHGTKAVSEPGRRPTAAEARERVHAYYRWEAVEAPPEGIVETLT